MPDPEQAEPPVQGVRRVVGQKGKPNWEDIPERTPEEKLKYLEELEGRGLGGYAGREIAALREALKNQKTNLSRPDKIQDS